MGNDMSGRGVGKYVNSIKSICVCFTSTAACLIGVFFFWTENRVPRSLLLNRTETLATQRGNARQHDPLSRRLFYDFPEYVN